MHLKGMQYGRFRLRLSRFSRTFAEVSHRANKPEMKVAIIFALSGFVFTVLTVPWLVALSQRGWGIDQSEIHRKNHAGRISRVGGLPLYGAFLLMMVAGTTYAPSELRPGYSAIALCGSLMFGLGFWDDLKPLGAKIKLLGQIIVACLAYLIGLRINLFTYPIGNFILDLGPWSFPITIFWLIAIPNIVNLIDGFDGLAAGLGLLLCVTLGVVAWQSEQPISAWVSFGLAGALAGFLFFNFPPAKIYLGDGGAYLIGFCVAGFSLEGSHKGSIAAALMVTIVALGLPILDTTFALVRRAIRGVPIFRGDREHIHHQLEQLGFSKRRVVLGMYAVCVALNMVGLSVFWSKGRTLPIAAGFIFVLALVAMRYLGYVTNFRSVRHQIQASLGRRDLMQYAVLQGELMKLEVDRAADADQFWSRFIEALDRTGLTLDRKTAEHTVVLRTIAQEQEVRLELGASGNSAAYWQRIADCFQRAFALGNQRWLRIRHELNA